MSRAGADREPCTGLPCGPCWARAATIAAGVAATIAIACPGAAALTVKLKTITIPSKFGCCWQLAAGPDHAVWVTEGIDGTGYLARITTGGSVKQFRVPGSESAPTGIAAGPDGNLWFADDSQSFSIARSTTAGVIQEYHYSQLSGTEQSNFPGWAGEDVVFASDGAMWSMPWSTGVVGNRLVTHHLLLRATLAQALSGGAETFSVPGNPVITALTRGPDGDIWFTQTGPAGVGRITATGQVTQYLSPFPRSDGLVSLTTGSDGNLWIVDDGPVSHGSARIARMTPSGAVSWFPVPNDPGEVESITSASDGTVWFTSREGYLGRITPSGSILKLGLAPDSDPKRIVTGPDGNLWLIDPVNSAVETFSPRLPCRVPRLVGLTQTQALAAVARTTCQIGRVSGARPRAEVHSQRPAAGTTVPDKTSIHLVLGRPSTLKVIAPGQVKFGSVFLLTVRGHAIAGRYGLGLAFDSRPCATTAAAQMQRRWSGVVSGVHGRFTVKIRFRNTSRGKVYACAYLIEAMRYTTAQASASYASVK